MVRSLDELVFFTDALGFVGMGVYTEVHDAARRGVRVKYLTDDGRFLTDDQFGLIVDQDADWREYALVGVAPKAATLDLR